MNNTCSSSTSTIPSSVETKVADESIVTSTTTLSTTATTPFLNQQSITCKSLNDQDNISKCATNMDDPLNKAKWPSFEAVISCIHNLFSRKRPIEEDGDEENDNLRPSKRQHRDHSLDSNNDNNINSNMDKNNRFNISEDNSNNNSSNSNSNNNNNDNNNTNNTPIINHTNLHDLNQLPGMVTAFDELDSDTKSTILLQLLKRSSTNTLQLVSSLIIPTLRRDFLSSLPKEVSLCVLSYLDVHTLCRASTVCRSWRDLINGDELLWKRRMIQDGFKHDDPWASQYRGSINTNSSTNPLSTLPSSPSSSSLSPSSASIPTFNNINNDNVNGKSNNTNNKNGTNPYKERYRRLYTLQQNWRKGRVRTTRLISHPHNVVTCLSVDEDKIISGADDHVINIYDAKTLTRRRCLRGHEGGVWALQHVGNTLVSGSTDRTVRVWNLLNGKCTHVFHGHISTVRCLQIVMPNKNNEPSQPLIIAGSRDSTIRIWRLPDPENDQPYDYASTTTSGGAGVRATTSSNNVNATSNNPSHALLPTTTTGTSTSSNNNNHNNPYHMYTLTGHTNSVRAIAAHGNILVSGSYDRKVCIWDLSKGTLIHRMEGHGEKVYSVVIDPERNQCMSGSMDACIKIWSLETGQCLRTLDGHSILVGLLGLSQDHLVSAAADTTLRVWSPQGDCMHALLGHQGAITCFQHDHEKVISGSEGGLKLWDIKTGKLLQNFVSYATGVWRVAFDQRKCVAAIHCNNITYLEVLDFGSHGLEEEVVHHEISSSTNRPFHKTKY